LCRPRHRIPRCFDDQAVLAAATLMLVENGQLNLEFDQLVGRR
jgi:hypothetical protein